MIVLNNITKKYKSKKGSITTALSNFSLDIADNGMVFIVGKSGSGKSTLLNVIGGLDKYDSGEMTILGKNSKDFTYKDFDSYRNTYIGFVFQEFNVLPDYNVYENIVIALELQKKDKSKEEIDNLLSKLELLDLKTRKTNELSGGQKQRVAIARALVKDPKIILADEPTGNLDSVTGGQVLDLLKEISKDRLVIVVSHDVDAAKEYGDRIIEMKDGALESDRVINHKETKDNSEYKIVKSSLPFKDSLKLGVGSLKHKKIKLFFTIVLTMMALFFLSLTDTLSSYDYDTAHAKLLVSKKENFVQIARQQIYDNVYFYSEEKPLKNEDYNIIKEKTNTKLYNVYKLNEDNIFLNLKDIFKLGEDDGNGYSYYNSYINGEIVATDNLKDLIIEDILGKLPSSSNEIIISNYLADHFIKLGVKTWDVSDDEFMIEEIYKPKSYEEILESNKIFSFGSLGKVKVVGIIEYNLDDYQIFKKELKSFNLKDRQIFQELHSKAENIYNKIYVKEDFFDVLEVKDNYHFNYNHKYVLDIENYEVSDEGYYVWSSYISEPIEYFDGTKWVTTNGLEKNEVLLNPLSLKGFDYKNYTKNLLSYLENNIEIDKEMLEKKFFENYFKDYNLVGSSVTLSVYENYSDSKEIEKFENLKVIGILGLFSNNESETNYFSKELLEKYIVPSVSKMSFLLKMNKESDFKKILKDFPFKENLFAKTTYLTDVVSMITVVKVLKSIAYYIVIAFVTFSIFLITSFVSTSVTYRKKEIGILRALGARSFDAIKVFLVEGLIIALISAVLSSSLLVVVTRWMNGIIMAGTSIVITPFIVGIRQVVVTFVLVIAVTIVANIIPIIKISSKKPIDAILEK